MEKKPNTDVLTVDSEHLAEFTHTNEFATLEKVRWPTVLYNVIPFEIYAAGYDNKDQSWVAVDASICIQFVWQQLSIAKL